MRASFVTLLLPACASHAPPVEQLSLWDPVLLAPTDQPIPEGLVATEPQKVEVKACGTDYRGLDDLLDHAREGGDGLERITVEIEHLYERPKVPDWAQKPLPVLVGQCYVLRAYRVTYRVAE